MRKTYFLPFVAAITFMSKAAFAQCGVTISTATPTVCPGSSVTLTATASGPATAYSLPTTLAAGNNHRGNMFDITAINTVTITSFDAYPMAATTIEIYYKAGTWSGFANSPGSWTLVGSAAVTPSGPPTPVPVAVNVTIPAGQTYAFYVTSTNTGVSLNYSNGTAVGNVYASDANIQFKEGAGLEYPFTGGSGSTFTPRIWNGTIHYSVPSTPTVTYLWNTSATTSSISSAVNSTTQYSVIASITGCPTQYDTLTVQASVPPVDAGAAVTVCAGTAVTLSASGAVSYLWDNSISDGVAFTPSSTLMYHVLATDSIGCPGVDSVLVTVNSLPAVNAGSDYAICAGAATVLYGSGAQSYTWDNSVSNGVPFVPAATATYIVTGTDANGCTNSDTVVVSVNPLPVVNGGADQVVCAGGAVTLNGSGAIVYSWDNNVTDGVPFNAYASQNYVLTGTDAYGCSNTDTVFVSVNALPAVNAGNDQSVCAGASAVLTGSGIGTLSWDNNITDGVPFQPAATQAYILTATDSNGCSNTDTVNVAVNSLPVVSAGQDITACPGSQVVLTGSGAVSYSWDNSVIDGVPFTPVASQAYVVTGTDANGCVNSDTVMVMLNTVNTLTTVVNETITASASGAAYQWINCATGNPVAGATSQSFTPAVNGSYAVIVTQNSCSDTSACTTISTIGIGEQSQAGFSLYPNPTEGRFVLQTGAVAEEVRVTDLAGKTVLVLVPVSGNVEIDLGGMASGTYFVQVKLDGSVITRKLVKN